MAAGKRQSEKLLRVTLISFAMTASVIQSENGGNLIKLGARTLPPQPRQCAPFLYIPQFPDIAYHRVAERMLGEAETEELSPFTGRVRRLGGIGRSRCEGSDRPGRGVASFSGIARLFGKFRHAVGVACSVAGISRHRVSSQFVGLSGLGRVFGCARVGSSPGMFVAIACLGQAGSVVSSFRPCRSTMGNGPYKARPVSGQPD